MMSKLTVIGLLMVLMMLSHAETPADVVRESKIAGPQVLDLSNTDPSVFNASAFKNQIVGTGRLNSTVKSFPQNDVGILDSTLSVLNTSVDLQQLKDVVHGNPR